jgi:hypothetical protein
MRQQGQTGGFTMSDAAGRCISLLADIDAAMMANNMHNDPSFRKDLCQCDPSVGMCPCAYCVIHDTLRKCKAFVTAKQEASE